MGLVYVVDGGRVVGYDNERGTDDHKHIGGVERSCDFTGVVTLLADFREDAKRARQ